MIRCATHIAIERRYLKGAETETASAHVNEEKGQAADER